MGQGFELRECPWYEGAMPKEIKALTSKGKAASDDGTCGLPNISDKISELRYSLTPEEMDRFRWLGRESEKAMNTVCRSSQTRNQRERDSRTSCGTALQRRHCSRRSPHRR